MYMSAGLAPSETRGCGSGQNKKLQRYSRESTMPLEMDGPHTVQASHQHHKASPQMEPPRKKEERQATKHLATRPWRRRKEDRPYLGTSGETGPGQRRLERPCRLPFQEGWQAEMRDEMMYMSIIHTVLELVVYCFSCEQSNMIHRSRAGEGGYFHVFPTGTFCLTWYHVQGLLSHSRVYNFTLLCQTGSSPQILSFSPLA